MPAIRVWQALWVIPSLQCFWSLSSITMGAIFFDEFSAFQPWMYGSFMGGVVCSLAGIAVVATSEMGSDRRTTACTTADGDAHAALLTREELLGQPDAEAARACRADEGALAAS